MTPSNGSKLEIVIWNASIATFHSRPGVLGWPLDSEIESTSQFSCNSDGIASSTDDLLEFHFLNVNSP